MSKPSQTRKSRDPRFLRFRIWLRRHRVASGLAWIARCGRVLLRWFALLLGITIFVSLVFSHYERAVTVSGRTEVLAVRADGSDFSNWSLPDASLAQGSDPATVPPGELTIDLADGASARFVRRGRGALSVSFVSSTGSGSPACSGGARRVGTVSLGDADPVPLCDDARVRVGVRSGDAPLVLSLRGGIAIGEEVRAGAGAQPLLLDGSAQLLVRHGAPFTALCRFDVLHNLCDRFVATRFDFSAGDTLAFRHAQRDAAATGFFRIDPEDSAGALRFDLAAADAALEVRRMKGDAFELSESLFDQIEKSPLLQTLNATLVALSLVWWFVRIPGEARGGQASVVALIAAAASLVCAQPAQAQQALLRAGETGQAMLRSRSDRCYAVTPRHVLGGETTATLVMERRALADADLLRLVPAAPETLAVLITRAVPIELCPAFTAAPSLDNVLRARTNAVLRLVRPDGSFDRMLLAVLSVDVETFEVRPQDSADVIMQGMSGGTVLIDDQPVGLLTDVRDEGRVGRVARLDRVFERLEPYLGAGFNVQSSPPKAVAGGGQAAITLVRWSAEPVSNANRADALLTGLGAPWRVSDDAADVVFRMGPERPVLSGVTIDASGVADPPRQVEVLLGSSEKGPWRSVANFALEPGDGLRVVAMPPTRAGFVLMRARQHQPDKSTMALARFGLTTAP